MTIGTALAQIRGDLHEREAWEAGQGRELRPSAGCQLERGALGARGSKGMPSGSSGFVLGCETVEALQIRLIPG